MNTGRYAGIEVAGWRILDDAIIKGLRWLRYNAVWEHGWGQSAFERAKEHARLAGSRLVCVLQTRADMTSEANRLLFMHWCLAMMRAHPTVPEWQICNEPDVRRAPSPEEPYGFDGSASDYARLLAGIYNRARGRIGESRIWMAGLAYEGAGGEAWLDEFDAAAGGAPFHVGAVHAYVYPGQDWQEPWRKVAALEERWRIHQRPVVVTETMLLCHESGNCPDHDPPQKNHPFHQEQAQYVAHTVAQAQAHRRSVIFYLDGPHWWRRCGAWHADWTPKPWRVRLREAVEASEQ